MPHREDAYAINAWELARLPFGPFLVAGDPPLEGIRGDAWVVIGDQTMQLISQQKRCRLMGTALWRAWWSLICPHCGQLKEMLFMLPGNEQGWGCKLCLRLTWRSSRESSAYLSRLRALPPEKRRAYIETLQTSTRIALLERLKRYGIKS